MRRALGSVVATALAGVMAIGLLLTDALVRQGSTAIAATRPDIIVLLLDDLPYMPDERVLKRLPNMRQLFLEDGMRFKQFYSVVALCGPSRITMITGQHPGRHGVLRNKDRYGGANKLNLRLQRAGYHTVLVGKGMHNADLNPDRGWNKRDRFGGQSERFRSRSVEYINGAPANGPLFAILSTNYPHVEPGTHHPPVEAGYQGDPRCAGIPLFDPPTYRIWNPVRPMPWNMPLGMPDGWKLKTVCESLLPIDEAIGSIIKAQRQRGRPVVWALRSDHGTAKGQHGFPAKYNPYAGRTELYLSGRGVPSKVSTDALLSDIDFAPTLAEAAGVQLWWKVDGRSFWPLVQGSAGFTGRQRVFECSIHPDPRVRFVSVRTKSWRAIVRGNGNVRLEQSPGWGKFNFRKLQPKRAAYLAAVAKDGARSRCR